MGHIYIRIFFTPEETQFVLYFFNIILNSKCSEFTDKHLELNAFTKNLGRNGFTSVSLVMHLATIECR